MRGQVDVRMSYVRGQVICCEARVQWFREDSTTDPAGTSVFRMMKRMTMLSMLGVLKGEDGGQVIYQMVQAGGRRLGVRSSA